MLPQPWRAGRLKALPLGAIPVLKHLFQLQTKNDVERTLFVFIHPIILRDDQVEDLKYLSDRDLDLAELPPNMPASRPIVMPLRVFYCDEAPRQVGGRVNDPPPFSVPASVKIRSLSAAEATPDRE